MRLRRKKVIPVMENLAQFIEALLVQVRQACNSCLIDVLADENGELAASINRFRLAHAMRGTTPASDEEYADAVAELLTRLTTVALCTGELMHRPGVRWLDETVEIALPAVVIPN